MTHILIATQNKHKIEEISAILTVPFETLEVYSIPEPEEPFDSFKENAFTKAKYYALQTNKIALSDDSGLCVDALNGWPGVKTKDFFEACGSQENVFLTLEERLKNKSLKAHFTCAISVYNPFTEKSLYVEEKVEGSLSFKKPFEKGFGFDPIFIPDGHSDVFSALGHTIKNTISHRAKALKSLQKELQNFLT